MDLQSRVRNANFDSRLGFERGVTTFWFAIWYFVKIVFLSSAVPWPVAIKRVVLRAFGAKIGVGVSIKPRVNIHFPWKFEVGDFSWIGEGVEIYNFETISIGANCCISQRVFLCAGNHDYRDQAMRYRNAPIYISDGVWVGACSFVGPGVRLGVDSVITAGSVVVDSVPPNMVCSGNPCVPIRVRWRSQ